MTNRLEDHETIPAPSETRRIIQVLAGALLMAAAVLAISYARSQGLIEDNLAHRLRGVIIGVFLVITGNAIPKTRGLYGKENCEPSTRQSFRRYAGWIFVLAGLGYTISWLAVPIAHAETVAVVFVAASIVLVLPRMVWCALKRRPSQPVGS